MESNKMYLISEGWEKSKRTRGIRIEIGNDICMGVAFLMNGRYRYQECLNNSVMRDEVAYLKEREVS